MRIPLLIEKFRQQGYEINLVGGELKCEATKYPLIGNQIATLKKHKQEIIEFLRREQRENEL